MVGDKGFLYSFRAEFGQDIEKLVPLDAHKLIKRSGKRFKKAVDSEGLALDPKGRLIISLERRPKIALFDTNGRQIKKKKLPKALSKRKAYRSRNKMLEAVAYHPRYGILTASELPIKSSSKKIQSIYSLNGKRWSFKAEPEKRSSITAIEVMDDGNMLVLVRAFSTLANRTITLKKIYLNSSKNGLQKSEILAKMSSQNGWLNDNFEGLVKVAPHRYLMVSDNNDNFFQKTLLIYFEVQ